MAKLEEGMVGRIIGKVGSIVGGRWRGITFVRAKGPSKRKNNSPAQVEQQAKFQVATMLANDMERLFKFTYRNRAKQMTARNSAFADIISEAVTGTYPNYSIDYSKVLISRGTLEQQRNPTVVQDQGTLDIEWNYVAGRESDELMNDRAIIVVYCPFYKNTIYNTMSRRADNGASINVSLFAGQTIYTWLSFITPNGKKIATSVFTGQFTVTV